MVEFNQDGGLNLDGTQRHTKSGMDVGIRGLVMQGTPGHNSSLRAKVIKFIKSFHLGYGVEIPVI